MSEPVNPADATTNASAPRRRSLPTQSNRPFQLMLVVPAPGSDGSGVDPDLADSVTLLPVPAASEATSGFASAGLSPADLRSRAMFLVEDGADLLAALSTYCVTAGFASRFLDVATSRGVVVANHHRSGRELPDAGKAPVRPDLVAVAGTQSQLDQGVLGEILGEDATDAEIRILAFSNDDGLSHLSPQEVSDLRSARRVVLFASSDDDVAFRELLQVAGARSRRNFERLPMVARQGELVDLDEMRRAGAELRKEHRAYQVATAERVEPTERDAALQLAASTPVEAVLAALGSECASDLWQCPRPWSHTHGDATASMQVAADNKVRCYVDDAEWIDPLRLVMEVCRVPADHAAELLVDLSSLEPYREGILAERARRSA